MYVVQKRIESVGRQKIQWLTDKQTFTTTLENAAQFQTFELGIKAIRAMYRINAKTAMSLDCVFYPQLTIDYCEQEIVKSAQMPVQGELV